MLQVSAAPPSAPLPLFAAHTVASTDAPPLTETSHCQAYVGAPVFGIDPETERAWFTSNFDALGVGAEGAVSAALAATVEEAGEGCVSGDEALSMTWSSKL